MAETINMEDALKLAEDAATKAVDAKFGELISKSRVPVYDGEDNGVAGSGLKNKDIVRWEPTGRLMATGVPEKKAVFETTTKETQEFLRALVKAGQTKTNARFVSKALGETSLTAGGYLVPGEFQEAILERAVNQSIFLQMGRVIPMRSDSFSMPRLKQTFGSSADYFSGITWAWQGEGSSISESTNPSLELETLRAKKVVGLHLYSSELAEDSPAFAGYLTNLLGRAYAWEVDSKIFSGNGVNEPVGLLTSALPQTASRATTSHFKFADVFALDTALDEAFDQPSYFCRKATLLDLINDVDNNAAPKFKVYFREASESIFKPRALNAYPVVLTKHAPALGTKGDVSLIDPASILIGIRREIELVASSEYAYATDQMALRLTARMDSKVVYGYGCILLAA